MTLRTSLIPYWLNSDREAFAVALRQPSGSDTAIVSFMVLKRALRCGQLCMR